MTGELIEKSAYNLPSERYLNRELSWLAFNNRVLSLSADPYIPLLERVRFLAIAANNMDEFFMVRVAGIMYQVQQNSTKLTLDGTTPEALLAKILTRASFFKKRQEAYADNLRKLLKKEAIEIVLPHKLTLADKKHLIKYAREHFLPDLSFSMIESEADFEKIPSKTAHYFVQLAHKENGEKAFGLVRISSRFEAFISLPTDKRAKKSERLVAIQHVLPLIFSDVFTEYEVQNALLFRVIRDSWLAIKEDADDLVQSFKDALEKRQYGRAVRLEVLEPANQPHPLLETLANSLRVLPGHIAHYHKYFNTKNWDQLCELDLPELKYKPYKTRFPERIHDYGGNYFDAIAAKDIVIHHPYESFDVVVQFLNQAAKDPKVTKIKQTLYRTSSNSPIVQALIEAAKAGKEVTAVVELKARFDEEANIKWGQQLEAAGARVVYSRKNYKIHCKISLVERELEGRMVRYAHYGTGNYHSQNARVYSDLSFFTCHPGMCEDAMALFDMLEGHMPEDEFLAQLDDIAVAPYNLHSTLISLIENEIHHAKSGRPAHIWIKVNSLNDPTLIEALYRASSAGVEIDIVARGICCLRAGVPGLSENIRVKSIVGRYLEHARIFCFGDGHRLPHPKAQVYISSADWMPRNMHRRFELMVPIDNPTVHEQILEQIMVANLKDRRNSWDLLPNGTYHRVSHVEDSFSAHHFFMRNPSLSGRGITLRNAIAESMPSNGRINEQQIAVIDIGSNSVRMVVYDGLKRRPYPLYNEKMLCGLATNMDDDGLLNPQGANMALNTLRRFSFLIKQREISSVYAFATSAVRDALDGEEFVAKVEEECGFEVQVLSGKEEARLAAMGIASAFYENDGVVGDLGGGSLEFASLFRAAPVKGVEPTYSENISISEVKSFPIGPLRLQSGLHTDHQKDFIDSQIQQFPLSKHLRGKDFYAVGGGFRALAKIYLLESKHPLQIIEQFAIDRNNMQKFIKKILDTPIEKLSELDSFKQIAPKRQKTLHLTALIMGRIIKFGKPERIVFSNHGVREGILFDQLEDMMQGQDALKAGVFGILELMSPRMEQEWTQFGIELYEWLHPLFMDETHHMSRLRYAACMLHNISWHEHTAYRAESSFHWVLDSEISAVDHWERMFIAACVYHRYKSSATEHVKLKMLSLLDDKWMERARMIGLALRFGYHLSGGAVGVLPQLRIDISYKTLKLFVPSQHEMLINEIVTKRFETLANKMGLIPEIISH